MDAIADICFPETVKPKKETELLGVDLSYLPSQPRRQGPLSDAEPGLSIPIPGLGMTTF